MDTLVFAVGVSGLTGIVVWAFGMRLKVWQSRHTFLKITRDALTTRTNALAGIIGVLGYLVIYFGLGNRVHYFYNRLIFTVTAPEAILAILSALLVGLLFALFVASLKQLGLTESKKGGWGVAGTLFAVLVSFCP